MDKNKTLYVQERYKAASQFTNFIKKRGTIPESIAASSPHSLGIEEVFLSDATIIHHIRVDSEWFVALFTDRMLLAAKRMIAFAVDWRQTDLAQMLVLLHWMLVVEHNFAIEFLWVVPMRHLFNLLYGLLLLEIRFLCVRRATASISAEKL